MTPTATTTVVAAAIATAFARFPPLDGCGPLGCW
ncbi:hypothetical protein M878_01065 [Streptomyces roseochromogenus subsp. oscitans DS 12.976]|uniref:Uncharacterized protein n=1 Tax=Streptomyces roseochromogenus subsp. oscitans DS 12.976 TaxID=1352936 RepID=V6KX78_STRRC|nr:hypothetical protein M878_01065 [Streptomyces roseochromogenus subsp. oscitans DS 12.976]